MKEKHTEEEDGDVAVRIQWTERAVRDLERIGEFIARDNPVAATRWVGRLLKAAENSARLPRAGRRVPELDRDKIPEALLRSYRVVYRVRDESIEILTIFEGHRQFPDDLP